MGKYENWLLAQQNKEIKRRQLRKQYSKQFRLRRRQEQLRSRATIEALQAEVARLQEQMKLQEQITEATRALLAISNNQPTDTAFGDISLKAPTHSDETIVGFPRY